jgi:arsenate reductase-like glutaredoxin family protein
MKIRKSPQQPKTLDEVCGTQGRNFEQFLKEKARTLDKMEKDTDSRIRQSLADKLAWSV